jgi:hypothetical protein
MSKKKKFLELVKDICADEAAELLVATGVDYKFYHYDQEVKAVVVLELSTTIRPVLFKDIKPLEKRLQNIDKKITVYILSEEPEEEYDESEYR